MDLDPERPKLGRIVIDTTNAREHTIPQQLHLDLTVATHAALDAVHRRVLELGGTLRLDRSDDHDEPLRVYADRDGHTFCVFVA